MIRVMTLNIWGYTEPYADRMRLVRDWIKSNAPDLLAFQEAACSEGRDQVRDLLQGLKYYVCHQLDGDIDSPHKEGICIASRWPINQTKVCPLAVTPACDAYAYAALAAKIEAPAPIGSFLFVTSKPSWELNREYERELQALRVVEMIEEWAKADAFPTILVGDFDATSQSASIRFLTGRQSLDGVSTHFLDAWEQAGDGTAGYTWTYENASTAKIIEEYIRQERHARRIDYIFLASPHDHAARKAVIRDCRVILDQPDGNIWASDHFGLCAEIEAL